MDANTIRNGILATCDQIGRLAGACRCRTYEQADYALCVETTWPLVEGSNCLIVYDESNDVCRYRVVSRSELLQNNLYRTSIEHERTTNAVKTADEVRDLV